MKRPSFQFYPGDWLNDAGLRLCSIGARGLWIEMLCLMHQGKPYGHLKVNNKAITEMQLVRMTGGDSSEVRVWLAELLDAGVCSQEDGVFVSRRMVKDEQLRSIRAAGGKEGGNPKLMGGYNKPGFVYAMRRESDGAVKIGISQDPAKRLYKVRAQYPGIEINVLGKLYVEDMGATEAMLHAAFSAKKSGEWFALDSQELDSLLENHLKVKLKVRQTPSSSSASSSSKEIPPPDGVSPSVWTDFLKLRKAKKAPMTDTALDGIRKEAVKAGLSLERALALCCKRGWQGFEAAWVKDQDHEKSSVWHESAAGVKAKAAELELDPHDEVMEPFPMFKARVMKAAEVRA